VDSTDVAKIKGFWQDRAREVQTDAATTHPDIWQRWLEIELIKPLVGPQDRVLDIGCGNGYTTRRIAPLVQEIIGADYSEEMIRRAEHPSGEDARCVPANMKFAAQDVTKLSPGSFGLFDVVLSERCLINLGTWEAQQRGLLNIAAVLKPGGRFIFVEGSADGRARLNELRQAVGLEPMPPVWHNVDFHEERLLRFLTPYYEVVEHRHFGVYDFLSRVIHPLLIAPETPRYEAKINEIAARAARVRQKDMGDISRVVFLVLRRNTTPPGA